MGIKHFFIWLKRNHPACLQNISTDASFEMEDIQIDNLCLDMNGIFHYCAQQVYRYGNFEQNASLLRKNFNRNGLKWQLKFFQAVCDRIEFLRKIVNPKKRLILCVDGVAGMAKMSQQRQRRYKSSQQGALKNTDFNPVCISPGTKVMDYLNKYVDWYIRMMISNSPEWENLAVVFSNEKVPGEGEHKIINYIRKYGAENESWCIHGLDADLIMLGLATHEPKMYILRENMYNLNELHVLNVSRMYTELIQRLKWEKSEQVYNGKSAIHDFVFMCFLVGNDFLPSIPTLAILEGGIDAMIDVYKQTCQVYGHLTRVQHRRNHGSRVLLRPEAIRVFLGTLSTYSKGLMEEKYMKKANFHPDEILNKNVTVTDDGCELNFDNYRKDFYHKKLQVDVEDEKMVTEKCHNYLRGMQWVLSYYTRGISSWTWYCKDSYAPFLCDLAKSCETYAMTELPTGTPAPCYLQLMYILPPVHQKLLPEVLGKAMKREDIAQYYPEKFVLDVSGKRQEWEGIVILPELNTEKIRTVYEELCSQIPEREKRLNQKGSNYIYKYKTYGDSYVFKSFYGHIPNCRAKRIPLTF